MTPGNYEEPETGGSSDEDELLLPEHSPELIEHMNQQRLETWLDEAEYWLPAQNLSTAAVLLYTVVRDSSKLETAKLLPGSDLRCSVYPIGGDDWVAAACPAPWDAAEQFWSIVCLNGITQVVNINPAGEAEEYYPEGDRFSLDLGLFRIRQKLPSRYRSEEEPPASKRVKLEPESEESLPVTNEKLRVIYTDNEGRKRKHRIRMRRVRDWQDGHGYDHKALIRIARKLPRGKTLIHCQAGLGRTGTLAVTMQLVDLFKRDQLPREKSVEVLVHLILQGRKERGDSRFVTTVDQFECLLRVLKRLFRFSEEEMTRQVNGYLDLLPAE